jgi:hypothetical protein
LVGHAFRGPAIASPFRGVNANDPDPQSALRVVAADGVEGVTVYDPSHKHRRPVGDWLTAAEQAKNGDHGRHRDHRGNDQGHESKGRRGTHQFTTSHAQLTSTDERQSRLGFAVKSTVQALSTGQEIVMIESGAVSGASVQRV